MAEARKLEITTFLNSPAMISRKARAEFTLRGSAFCCSWGISSRARTMGPATRWGKKAR